MCKTIKSSEIIEISLNPKYFVEEDLKTLINRGFSARWMTEDEKGRKNYILYL